MNEKINYSCYNMNIVEKLTGFLIGFSLVFIILILFFESIIVGVIAGAALGIVAVKPFNIYLKKQRKKKLLLQFKDFLESLTASYAAGSNTQNAFLDTLSDIELLHGQTSYMAVEISDIKTGLENGVNIEDLIKDFGERSDIDDIRTFAGIFDVCIRTGGNISTIIAETREIICDKIEIEMEIKTSIVQKKCEFYIMCVMPFIMVAALRFLGDSSFSASNVANLVVRAVALVMIIISFILGKVITDIKI